LAHTEIEGVLAEIGPRSLFVNQVVGGRQSPAGEGLRTTDLRWLSGGGRVASGQWPVVSGQRSGRQRTDGVRKAPNKANLDRPLITCHQGIKIDRLGIVYAKQTQFRGIGDRGTLGTPNADRGFYRFFKYLMVA